MGFKKWHLILASRSPRRRSILKGAGFECTILSTNSSESFSKNLSLTDNLSAIAERKVEAAVKKLSPQKQKGIVILGADTVVVRGKRVLGKPRDAADAR